MLADFVARCSLLLLLVLNTGEGGEGGGEGDGNGETDCLANGSDPEFEEICGLGGDVIVKDIGSEEEIPEGDCNDGEDEGGVTIGVTSGVT